MRLNPFSGQASRGDRTGPDGRDDYGFGEQVSARGVRLLDKDGNFNVRRLGMRTRFAYQYLIQLPWMPFLLWVLAYYVAVNLAFAVVFWLLGPGGIDGVTVVAPWYQHLAECFFFSVQTFTTVGYGSMAPVHLAHQVVASLGALVGLMSLALATGLTFARFSRPARLVVFSERAVIAPYKDVTAFEFRLANRSSTKLINVRCQVIYSWIERSAPANPAHGDPADGLADDTGRRRRFFALPLEREEIAMFPLNWTVVHPITPDSPLVDCTAEGIDLADGEFIVQVSGYDETYARQVYAHTSYRASCIQWGKRFLPMYHPAGDDDGAMTLHLDHIDHVEDAPIYRQAAHVKPEAIADVESA